MSDELGALIDAIERKDRSGNNQGQRRYFEQEAAMIRHKWKRKNNF